MIFFIVVLILILTICYVYTNWISCETINWDKLPETIRVGQISDLHGKIRYINGKLSDKINALNLDYLLVTGDLIKRKADMSKIIKELSKIKIKQKVFVLLGNYEAVSGINSQKALGIENYNLQVLINDYSLKI